MNRLFQMLSFMLLFSLFIGCGKETVPPKNSILPTNDGLPYHFAEGHYEMDENGFPLAPYEYQLPLCNTNEKLTYLIRLPDMDLVEDISRLPQILQLKEYTGVSIEYILLETSFAGLYETIMASDYDYDILSGNREYMEAAYKSGNKGEHWCNLFEYRQYCPNYLYQSTRDLDDLTFDTVFYDDETIPFFYTILDKSVAASGYMARGDWLDEAGLSCDTIVTWDDVHEMLRFFQLQQESCENPIALPVSIEFEDSNVFSAFDTLPLLREDLIGLPYVVDGVVKLAHTNENDKELLTMLHQWYSEGLIASEVISYGSHNALYDYMIENGKVGYANIFPEDVLTYEYNTAEDPDCRWDAIRKPLRTDDQVLHLGGKKNRVLYAAAAVNIRCENIPLAVSWLDYRYSPSGSQYLSYGPEGYLWEQDESGNYIAAAGSLESGYAGFKDLSRFYGINIYEEAGMELLNRRYIIPGGDRLLSMYAVWDDYSYDGAYEWPSKIVLTQAQTEEMNQTASYIKNYVQNNYFGFIDGSRDLSEWDAYIAHLNELGIGRILEIYQDAYNSHMT